VLELLNVYTAKCPPLAAHPRERAQVQEVLELMVIAALALVHALLDRQTRAGWPWGGLAPGGTPAPSWSEPASASTSHRKLEGVEGEERNGGGQGRSAQQTAAAARERLAKVQEKRQGCVRGLRALSAHLAVVMERVWKDCEEGPGTAGATVMGGATGGAHGLTTKVVDSLKLLIRATPGLPSPSTPAISSASAAAAPPTCSEYNGSPGVPQLASVQVASAREELPATASAQALNGVAGGNRAVWMEQAHEAVAVLASLNRPMFIKSWRKDVVSASAPSCPFPCCPCMRRMSCVKVRRSYAPVAH
jgi:hypothetical protein